MKRLSLSFCLTTWVVTAILASSCGVLPPFYEGPEHVVATKPAWIARGHDVQACLTRFARRYFNDSTITYRDSLNGLVVMMVSGDGVIGTRGSTTYQAFAAERGDTILFNQGVDESSGQFIAAMRHEFVHVTQARHRELIGAGGNVHWAPPFAYCQIPLAIFSS